MGVNLFGGKFKQCLDANGVLLNVSEVYNRSDCEARKSLNYTWFNPKINFDNVLMGYLALFQVVRQHVWHVPEFTLIEFDNNNRILIPMVIIMMMMMMMMTRTTRTTIIIIIIINNDNGQIMTRFIKL